MEETNELRHQLVQLLTAQQAHMLFEDAVADFPETHINQRVPNSPYSFWQLVEHLRLTQRDILDYISADEYHWPTWPADYWPAPEQETDWAGWQQSVDQFLSDRQRLVALVTDPRVDLLAPLPNSGEREHNLLREVLIVASHNAYHTGELGILRQAGGLWPKD